MSDKIKCFHCNFRGEKSEYGRIEFNGNWTARLILEMPEGRNQGAVTITVCPQCGHMRVPVEELW